MSTNPTDPTTPSTISEINAPADVATGQAVPAVDACLTIAPNVGQTRWGLQPCDPATGELILDQPTSTTTASTAVARTQLPETGMSSDAVGASLGIGTVLVLAGLLVRRAVAR